MTGIFLMVIMVIFLLALLFWVLKKIDPSITLEDFFKPLTNFITPSSNVQNLAPMYSTYRMYNELEADYGNFGDMVFTCAVPIEKAIHLKIPATPQKIYAANLNTRIRLINGIYTFAYEFNREGVQFIGGMKTEDLFPVAEIQRIFETNLPNSMRGGYYYTGNIDVWDIGDNRIRVEIHGVNRLRSGGGGYINI